MIKETIQVARFFERDGQDLGKVSVVFKIE